MSRKFFPFPSFAKYQMLLVNISKFCIKLGLRCLGKKKMTMSTSETLTSSLKTISGFPFLECKVSQKDFKSYTPAFFLMLQIQMASSQIAQSY
jgi:hypothetical protein